MDDSKLQLFDEWMKADHVLVHLDSRRPGVEVPAVCRNNPALVLKLSYHFAGETTRSDDAITAYLKFSGLYERCILPWAAIWGFTSSSGEQRVWPNEVPPEVVVQLAVQKLKEVGKRVLKRGGAPEKDKKASSREKKGHLKRIK